MFGLKKLPNSYEDQHQKEESFLVFCLKTFVSDLSIYERLETVSMFDRARQEEEIRDFMREKITNDGYLKFNNIIQRHFHLFLLGKFDGIVNGWISFLDFKKHTSAKSVLKDEEWRNSDKVSY